MITLMYRIVKNTKLERFDGVFFENSDDMVSSEDEAFELYKGIYILYYKTYSDMISPNSTYYLQEVS